MALERLIANVRSPGIIRAEAPTTGVWERMVQPGARTTT